MEEYVDKKKIVISTIIGVSALVIAIIGASFAYFGVEQINSTTASNITADTESVGSVTLVDGSSLILALTAEHMAMPEADVTYWATVSGTPELTQNDVIIATATVVGNGTMYCDYTMTVTKSATDDLYTAFTGWTDPGKGNDQIVLKVNNGEPSDNIQTYDFNDANLSFPITYNGRLTQLVDGTPRNITANFKLVNLKDINQSILAGRDLTFTFTFTNFQCEIETDTVDVHTGGDTPSVP